MSMGYGVVLGEAWADWNGSVGTGALPSSSYQPHISRHWLSESTKVGSNVWLFPKWAYHCTNLGTIADRR